MIDATRHARGEYYTPRWLADFVLDEAGYDGAPGMRLLDPSCGPGVFLAAAIERAKAHAPVAEPPRETARRILKDIQGFELNPRAVEAARCAYLEALGSLAQGISIDDVPVRCLDAVLQPPEREPFDLVVGNPPWVRWDFLSAETRQATLPLWKSYGLFSLAGFKTLLGGGKKDFSMLFTYVAADRYLRPGGTLAFVITQEVFKSKGAGEGFRRFRLGEDGPPLSVTAVHDLVKVRPFKDAANKTAVLLLTKGRPTVYPVPYYVWTLDSSGSLERQALEARPLGSDDGPWQTIAHGDASLSFLDGPNAYRPMLGANANPYGVFWLEVRRALPGGLAEVRNLPELGKTPIPPVAAVMEAGPIYPALRGADVSRWHAAPRVHVLVVQDPATRCGYAEPLLRARWPRVLEYLEQFRETLLSRALYRRYHQQAGHPYYSQFNIAPETFAPFKVVWKRMTNDLAAAVVSEWDGPLGAKLILPLETTAFIGLDNADEAHYLCAYLNSGVVRRFVKSFSAAGRGFGTPSAIGRVRIPKFDPANPAHLKLAEISRHCHRVGQAVPPVERFLTNEDALLDGLVKSASGTVQYLAEPQPATYRAANVRERSY